MFGSTTNHGRIRRSALFMLLALAVEVLSMFWRHPLSFYCFVAAGSVLGFGGRGYDLALEYAIARLTAR